MSMTTSGPWSLRDPASLLHALELHQAELEVQNAELQAANEELRTSHEALRVVHDRFRTLYHLAPTPYVTIDTRRAILDLNLAAETLLDASRLTLVGGTIDVFVDDAGRARFHAFVDAVFADGRARCGDVVLARGDGGRVDVMVDGVLLREAPADPPRVVLAIVDITDRKVAELARRQAQDEVLAIVSHDLRGPLNAIGLACDALASGLGPADHAECVLAVQRASARCERLIKDLLRVAHLESGRLALDVAPFDVRDLVREVCRDHEAAVAVEGAPFTLLLADDPQVVIGDRDRLHQAISNQIGNALVHARGASIEVSVVTRGAEVVVAVADDGPGIAPEDLPIVFERYRQGRRNHGGAGLGLAIVKGLAEAHHGHATVTSRLGHGSRFEISLPVDPARTARTP
jgi:PAS domain S-box-containing protein